jgi:hypothetical protein
VRGIFEHDDVGAYSVRHLAAHRSDPPSRALATLKGVKTPIPR